MRGELPRPLSRSCTRPQHKNVYHVIRFLQRIRLAEIARDVIDQKPLSAGLHNFYASRYFAVERTIEGVPTLLRLEYHELCHDSDTDKNALVLAYMLNSLIDTQRCRFHLISVASDYCVSTVYFATRDTCLRSARRIVDGGRLLTRSRHSFVNTNLRLTGFIYSVCIASIALLMHVCSIRSLALEEELSSRCAYWSPDEKVF
jgi:hypothetical protein